MSRLLETYGKTVMVCIVASIMILFTFSLKDVYYREIYPQHNESSIAKMYDLNKHLNNYPRLVTSEDVDDNKITIKRGDPDYDLRKYKNSKLTNEADMVAYKAILENYKKYVKAERTQVDSTPIEVKVFGADGIDVTRSGRVYQLFFVAENDLGLIAQKKLYVLVD